MTTIDLSKAVLRKPDMFKRFRVPNKGLLLRDTGLPSDTDLIVFERGIERRALITQQMAYHHLAQGKLAGEAYLVSF